MKLTHAAGLAILLPMLAACGGSDGGSVVATDGGTDAGTTDTGTADTGTDGGATDTGTDGGATDTGTDGGATDTGTDGGATDTGTDGGATDTGTDGGATDSGTDGGTDGNTDGGTDGSASICCLQEDRTPPAPGSVIASSAAPIVPNGVEGEPDAGPQSVSFSDNASFPGLRYGNFLVLNNAFAASNTSWTDWSQSISLNDGSPVIPEIVWDWGLESQKGSQRFETSSFPELVYGTKSPFERSGDFQATGLPVEEANRPEITINYSYSRTAGTTTAPLGSGDTAAQANDSEHNVIIESFWHDSCEIVRNGGNNDNQVMEILIWFYHGERLPSGQGDIVETGVQIDGQSWTVYRKSSNFNFLAYVSEDALTNERQSGTINYDAFIDHMRANAANYNVYRVQDTDCFANILFGPEVFHGAGTFTINDFTVTRTY